MIETKQDDLKIAIDAAQALARAIVLRRIPAPHGVWGRIKVCDFFEQEVRIRAARLDANQKAQFNQVLRAMNLIVPGL